MAPKQGYKQMVFWPEAVFVAHFNRGIKKTDETLRYMENGNDTFGVVLDIGEQGSSVPLPSECKIVYKPIGHSERFQ